MRWGCWFDCIQNQYKNRKILVFFCFFIYSVKLFCVILQDELKNEILCLKKAVESSELQCLELQVRHKMPCQM